MIAWAEMVWSYKLRMMRSEARTGDDSARREAAVRERLSRECRVEWCSVVGVPGRNGPDEGTKGSRDFDKVDVAKWRLVWDVLEEVLRVLASVLSDRKQRGDGVSSLRLADQEDLGNLRDVRDCGKVPRPQDEVLGFFRCAAFRFLLLLCAHIGSSGQLAE